MKTAATRKAKRNRQGEHPTRVYASLIPHLCADGNGNLMRRYRRDGRIVEERLHTKSVEEAERMLGYRPQRTCIKAVSPDEWRRGVDATIRILSRTLDQPSPRLIIIDAETGVETPYYD